MGGRRCWAVRLPARQSGLTICEWNESRESRDYGAGGGLAPPPGGSSGREAADCGDRGPDVSGGGWPTASFRRLARCFINRSNLLALLGRQEGVNLLPRFRQLLAGLRFEAGAQFAHALLALGHDLVNPLALLGGKPQLAGEDLHKFPVEERGTRPGGIRRPESLGASDCPDDRRWAAGQFVGGLALRYHGLDRVRQSGRAKRR